MLLTQEPTFVMVVTQEPTTKIYKRKKEKKRRKIAATHAFQNHGMIYCYIPSSCKSQLQSQKVFKRINA